MSNAHGFEIKKRRQWPWLVAALAVVAIVAGGVIHNASSSDATNAGKDHFGRNLKVAYLSTDGAQQAFLEYVATKVAPDYGITVEPTGIGDPNQLQAAVSNGEIAATVYAHKPWLAQSDAANGTKVTATEPVFQWAYSVWSSKHPSFADLPHGASVAILDDPANTAQALGLLANAHVVTLKDGVDPAVATVKDIASNPRGLRFKPIAFGTAARTLDDFDAIISYNFEFTAAGTPVKDRIFAPPAPRTFAAQLAVGTPYVHEATIKKLVAAFADKRVHDYLATTKDHAVAGQLTVVSAQ